MRYLRLNRLTTCVFRYRNISEPGESLRFRSGFYFADWNGMPRKRGDRLLDEGICEELV